MWRWDPFDEMRRIQEQMNCLFEDSWGPVGQRRLLGPGRGGELMPQREMALSPFVDVRETEDSVVVTADIPGVPKEDINISVTDDTLEISAERKEEVSEEKEHEGFVRRERYYSRFYRAVPLPVPVDEAKARAELNNGVLEVTLPRSKAAEKKRHINIS